MSISDRRAYPDAIVDRVRQQVFQARIALERLDRDAALKAQRAASLDDLVVRFEAELAEHESQLASVEAAIVAEAVAEDLAERLALARAVAEPTREAAAAARTAYDLEIREHEGRARRRDVVARELQDWTGRAAVAGV